MRKIRGVLLLSLLPLLSACTRGYNIDVPRAASLLNDIYWGLEEGSAQTEACGRYFNYEYDLTLTSSSSSIDSSSQESVSSSLAPQIMEEESSSLSASSEDSSSSSGATSSSETLPVLPNYKYAHIFEYSIRDVYYHEFELEPHSLEDAPFSENWFYITDEYFYQLSLSGTNYYNETTYVYEGMRSSIKSIYNANYEVNKKKNEFMQIAEDVTLTAQHDILSSNSHDISLFSNGPGDLRGYYVHANRDRRVEIDFAKNLPNRFIINDPNHRSEERFDFGIINLEVPNDLEKFVPEVEEEELTSEASK